VANRISRLQLPHLALSMDRARLTRAAEDALAWRPPRGNALRLLLYRAAWAPLWVWSDVPAPRVRLKEGPLPPGGPA